MTITEAFEDILYNAKPEDCCMNANQMAQLRFRYKQGCQIGHKSFLQLLQCRGYVITIEKESSEVVVNRILELTNV